MTPGTNPWRRRRRVARLPSSGRSWTTSLMRSPAIGTGSVTRVPGRPCGSPSLPDDDRVVEQHERPEDDREQRIHDLAAYAQIREVVVLRGHDDADDHVDERQDAETSQWICHGALRARRSRK